MLFLTCATIFSVLAQRVYSRQLHCCTISFNKDGNTPQTKTDMQWKPNKTKCQERSNRNWSATNQSSLKQATDLKTQTLRLHATFGLAQNTCLICFPKCGIEKLGQRSTLAFGAKSLVSSFCPQKILTILPQLDFYLPCHVHFLSLCCLVLPSRLFFLVVTDPPPLSENFWQQFSSEGIAWLSCSVFPVATNFLFSTFSVALFKRRLFETHAFIRESFVPAGTPQTISAN